MKWCCSAAARDAHAPEQLGHGAQTHGPARLPAGPLAPHALLWALGHRDFILCLGYQGDVVRRYFMDYKEWLSNDFVYSEGGARIELLKRDIDGCGSPSPRPAATPTSASA